jgi:hypothetical protein
MSDHEHSSGGVGRRQFLAAGAAVPALAGVSFTYVSAQEPKAAAGNLAAGQKWGIPGPYPGRVIEVRNPRMIKSGVKSREAIHAGVDRGMKELTGATDAVEAWRSFFEPGDVVGVKMNPVGRPLATTSFELMLEVIDGLKAAGVKTKDIVVFERYRDEFIDAKIHEAVPDGIAWTGLGIAYNGKQVDIKGDDEKTGNLDRVTGYDPDEFMVMELVMPGLDPKDDRTRRSHLGLLVTRRVNKLVLLPVLKDHGSAGVTGALKNMSHGSVNNVARSHSNSFSVVCNQFIPQVVTNPIIREKFVLHIMDGIRAVYHGGPFAWERDMGKWCWEYNSLLLATDPVAMDHVEWDIVDAYRVKMKMAPVGGSGRLVSNPLGDEGFDVRQPQYIALAGALGMGHFDYKSPRGRRYSIQHKTVNA